MTNGYLNVPWAVVASTPRTLPTINAVDVLREYKSAIGEVADSTLDQPWSDQQLPVPHLPEVDSLIGMVLSG